MDESIELLMNLMENEYRVTASKISKRFGIKEMLADKSKRDTFLVSFKCLPEQFF